MAAIGVIGLAVMGQNLALNIAEHGFNVSVYNRTTSKMTDTVERAKADKLDNLKGYETIDDFVKSLSSPKKVIIMVKAGDGVDKVISQISPLMSRGDVIIDGGNEYFKNTERRITEMGKVGIEFLGMGISGGEEGARKGPSLMPGGSKAAYTSCEKILKAISAKAFDGSDCVTYIGTGGAGHFVKMVHNGIEYADMQGIADAYHIMRKMGIKEMEQADIFDGYNKGDLASYLTEITAKVLRKPMDNNSPESLVSCIKPVAGSKGTGKWTIQEAANLGIPVDSIEAAYSTRSSSALCDVRKALTDRFGKLGEKARNESKRDDKILGVLYNGLWAVKVMAYAQGVMLLQKASSEHQWSLKIEEIARIWQGGCIIRAQLLIDIRDAWRKEPDLPCLLLADTIANRLFDRATAIQDVIQWAVPRYISIPAFTAAYQWLSALANGDVPANLIQAQRDFFGAHTYERIDKPGTFHTEW